MSPRSGIAVRTNHFRSGLGVEYEMSTRFDVMMRSTTAGGLTHPSFFRTSSGFHPFCADAAMGRAIKNIAEDTITFGKVLERRTATLMQASRGRFGRVKTTTIEYGRSRGGAGVFRLEVMPL